MKKLWIHIYTMWAAFWFVLIFLMLFPFFVLIIQNKKWHSFSFYLNRIWSWCFYTIVFAPVEIKFLFSPQKNQRYIFCGNHTSFLDIATFMYSVPSCSIFIGKSSLGKLPLFGYMFRNLHIPVDRAKIKSRYDSFDKAKQALAEGKNVIVFPEGGIVSKTPPQMGTFKEGAFRMAIEKQIPIVPVTILNNWKIIPTYKNELAFYGGKSYIIYHPPIDTQGMTIAQLDELKEKVYHIIDSALPHEKTSSSTTV